MSFAKGPPINKELEQQQQRMEAQQKQQNLELQQKQLNLLRRAGAGFGSTIAPTSLLGGGPQFLG